uniref:Prosaposin n=1 Tax=Nothobranchius kuhntae TaxID=321403 RepID=A0A1A8KVP6_NOTKU
MLLLTLLFVSSAVATPLLGTEQCARGAPYWCQNVKTASLCGAVAHCQQNVWNKPQLKTVPCDLCKEVLMVVEQLLKDNATESEILWYLEKACQLIPEKDLTSECKEIVDNYYPILYGIITGELQDPGVVCGAMGLCKSQQMSLAMFPVQEKLTSNEIPENDVLQVSPFLLNVPGLLYPQENLKESKETPKQENDVVCDDCVKFLTDAQNEAKSNTTFVDALIASIEKQCELLGPGMSDICKQYVGEYGTVVIQQLMSMEQEPKDICSRAGFCAAVKSAPMLDLQPAKTVPAAQLFPAMRVESTPVKQMVRVHEPPACAICEFVMKQVESMLEDQATEEQIVHAVESVCSFLPSTLTAQCKDLVETYGQAIIELLVQQADPKTVCTVLALCNGANRAFVEVLNQPRFEAGGYCDVCKLAVKYIDGILEKNATEAEIEEAVKKVCSFLPDSYRTECDQLIEQYEPMLVQMMLQMLDPDFVCTKVGACPEATRKLLGTERCSWGPDFWCKNMQTASLCNAVAHCRRHVWA